MARILALDLGLKRTGVAVTDPLQMIAQPLDVVDSPLIFKFLTDYFSKEEVTTVVIGLPYNLDGTPTHNTDRVLKFIEKFKSRYPHIPIVSIDEAYTSKVAAQTLVQAGVKKKKRQEKGNLDKVSAAIILQDYLLSR